MLNCIHSLLFNVALIIYLVHTCISISYFSNTFNFIYMYIYKSCCTCIVLYVTDCVCVVTVLFYGLSKINDYYNYNNSYLTVIDCTCGAGDLDAFKISNQIHHYHCQITILLAHDPLSPLLYYRILPRIRSCTCIIRTSHCHHILDNHPCMHGQLLNSLFNSKMVKNYSYIYICRCYTHYSICTLASCPAGSNYSLPHIIRAWARGYILYSTLAPGILTSILLIR